MSRNSKELESFTEYCLANPEERFFQALRNWSKVDYIGKGSFTREGIAWEDTFYEEDI